jgi:hypothetical protein
MFSFTTSPPCSQSKELQRPLNKKIGGTQSDTDLGNKQISCASRNRRNVVDVTEDLAFKDPIGAMAGLHFFEVPLYRVFQEERSIFWEVIVSVILSKKLSMNM